MVIVRRNVIKFYIVEEVIADDQIVLTTYHVRLRLPLTTSKQIT